MIRTIKVVERQRVLLFRNGIFVRMLGPGTVRLFDPSGTVRAHYFSVVRDEVAAEWTWLIDLVAQADPALAEAQFAIVTCAAGEAAVVSMDGVPAHVVTPGTRRIFWRAVTRIDVERIDLTTTLAVDPRHLPVASRTQGAVANQIVYPYEAGLLFVDGVLRETLGAGNHAFWTLLHRVEIRRFDQRPLLTEVVAQELLTRDRVSVRVTLTCFSRIADALRMVGATPDHAAVIYRLAQFAVRLALAERTLDQALDARGALDAEIEAAVRAGIGDIGVVVESVNIKDIILPGDMRALLNRVVEAEKVAQANLIRRREETAATRSALNTARLMDDNPTLMRLKELETLERLVERVGHIDLHAGSGGLDALLDTLLRSRIPPPGKPGD